MTNNKHICIILLLMASAIAAGADVWHYPGIGLSVAESSLLTQQGTSLGIDGAVAGGYTLRVGHFLIGTGVELSASRTVFRTADAHHEMTESVDRDGYRFTFVYDITGRRDGLTAYRLGVPLRVGAMFNPVYFLVGATLSVPLHSSGDISADVSTYGDYPHFLDPFTSMPEHQYFSSAPRRWKSIPRTRTDVLLSAEIGYLFARMQSNTAFAIALFADYGLLSAISGQLSAVSSQPSAFSYPATFNDEDMLTPLEAHHTLGGLTNKANSLRIGVRLSVIFPHKNKSRNTGPCRCMPFN